MPLLTKYKGQPLLILNPKVKPPGTPFSFGIAKAKVIIDRYTDIKRWNDDPDSSYFIDITPPINKTGKKYILNKDKANLIMEHIEDIQKFVDEAEITRETAELERKFKHRYSKPLNNEYEPDRFASE